MYHQLSPLVQVIQATALQAAEANLLLHEYYEEIQVVQRDSTQAVSHLLSDRYSGFWIAYQDGEPAGCVLLRALLTIPQAGECKRLYVRPAFRRQGVAETLLDVMENFARQVGLQWIYLDSKDDLQAAIALYQRRGYQLCSRYNDNPQATIFLRKGLAEDSAV